MAKKIRVTETALRDAHQSLIATRMTTEEMLPILDKLDKSVIIHLSAGAVQHMTLVFVS